MSGRPYTIQSLGLPAWPTPPVPLQEPIPLTPHQREFIQFPGDALSDTLRKAAAAIYEKVQCPLALAAMSVLGAASLAVQGHANVVIPATGQTRPVSLFLLSIAQSSERKTTADNEATVAVKQREKQLEEESRHAFAAYRNQLTVWESEKKRIINSGKLDAADKLTRLNALIEPIRPLSPILTCPEPTIEGLLTLMLNGQPSLGLFSDEGGSFVGGHSMNEEARLRTASILSQLWNGETVKRVRAAKDETYSLRDRRLTLHLMMQPVVANKLFAYSDLQGQGLFSRTLIAQPESTIGTRFQQELSDDIDKDIQQFSRDLSGIFSEPLPITPGTRNQLSPRALPFHPATKERWREYADEVEADMDTGGRYEGIRDFAGKLLEHASRIAAVMTLVEHGPDVAYIDLDMLNRAIEIADYFAKQKLILVNNASLSPETQNAMKLLHWLQDTWDGDYINSREIMHSGPTIVRERKPAIAAIETLIQHNWLHPCNTPQEVAGHLAKHAWLIRGKRK